MASELFEIKVRGKPVNVPSVCVADRRVIVRGRFLRIASVYDDEWIAGEPVVDAHAMVAEIRASGLKADLFTFAHRLPNVEPRYSYPTDWDNVAAVRVTSFKDWWENRLSQVSRKNVRRSAKRGVVVRLAPFDDALVQ